MIDRRKRRRSRVACWLLWITPCGLVLMALQQQGLTNSYATLVGMVLALALAHRWMWQPGGVPVLMYHSVSTRTDWLPWADEISVRPKTFTDHLATLQDMRCNVISAQELVEARQRNISLPQNTIVITLDDGYLDNWVAAFPLLKRFDMPATIFVSTDFIEPGTKPRPNLDDVAAGRCKMEELQWEGYLNQAELQLLQDSGLIDIESHGTDHSRVSTGPRIVDTLMPHNWRQLAWLQWGAMLGNKSDWFRATQPPQFAYGTPVHEHQPALAAYAWHDGITENEDAYRQRVMQTLQTSRDELTRQLGKEVRLFCWPYETTNQIAHNLALKTGFSATTGGMGENRSDEAPTVISRIPINERALGWPWPWAERLALRANVRLFQGIYYWYLVLLPMHVCRRVYFQFFAHKRV